MPKVYMEALCAKGTKKKGESEGEECTWVQISTKFMLSPLKPHKKQLHNKFVLNKCVAYAEAKIHRGIKPVYTEMFH